MTQVKGNLKVEVRESIELNGNLFNSYNSQTLKNITDVSKRIVTVPPTTLDSDGEPVTTYKGQEILAMSTIIGSGTFVEEKVRYIRITNLSDEYPVLLTLKNEGDEEFLYKLDKLSSFLYSGEAEIVGGTSGSGVQNSFNSDRVTLPNTDSMKDLVNILAMASSSVSDIQSGAAGSGSGAVKCNVELFVATT
tara:strand:- start:136 stop:711 length:576 start_codon:yes stop_codon:yes gene_type:complete